MKKFALGILRDIYYTKARVIHKFQRNSDPKVYRLIQDILGKFHDYGGKKNIWQEYKLYSLHKNLQKYQPKSILELGTGSSTSVFSEYIRANPDATLTCVDENEYWLENAAKIAGIEKGDSHFKLILSDRVIKEVGTVAEIKYAYEICDKYDMIFIDGPSALIDGKTYSNAINTNVLEIPIEKLPEVILVDTRLKTVDEMVKKLSDYYEMRLSDKHSGKIKYNYRFFTEFILKKKH